MELKDVKNGLNNAWESVADGWRRLRESATGALTHFKPEEKSALPAQRQADDGQYFPSVSWAMLAGNVFEDGKKVVVCLEIPGMDKDSLSIESSERELVVSVEKRFQRERSEGRYQTFQCAYGSFRRVVSLPAAVIAEQAKAEYRDGVLRIELPKHAQQVRKVIDVTIN